MAIKLFTYRGEDLGGILLLLSSEHYGSKYHLHFPSTKEQWTTATNELKSKEAEVSSQ